MNLTWKNHPIFKKLLAVTMSLLLSQPGYTQSVQNQMFSFEGLLTDSSGNPINLQSQQLFFFVTALDASNNNCVLFAESATVSGDADGNINHRFGSGLAVSSPVSYNNTLGASVFAGSASGKLADGSGTACSVAANATRVAEVYSTVLNVTAAITLGAAPYAIQANNSSLLNGKTDADFLLAASVSGGTTGQVLSRSASNDFTWINLPAAGLSALPAFTGDVSSASGSAVLTVVALNGVSISATAPASGQALIYNGSQWAATTVTPKLSSANNLSDLTSSATARANLGLGSLAVLNSIDLSSQVSGTLPQSSLPSLTGDVTSTTGSNSLTVTGLRSKPISTTSPASGQVLAYNGSQWAPANANYVKAGGDALTGFYSVDGGLLVASTTAVNNDILPLFAIRRMTSNASNGADGLGSALLFEAENSTNSTVAQAAILSKWTTATTATEQGQLEFQTRFNTTMNTRMTITAGGKVGIGTTSPNAMLDVQGTVKIGSNGAGSTCSAGESGVIRYQNNQIEFCNGSKWQASGYWSQDSSDGYYNSANIAVGTTDVDPNHLAFFKQTNTASNAVSIETTGSSSGYFGLLVTNGGNSQFVVKNDNRVGVNVFQPQANFHVSGTALVDGNLIVSGTVQFRSPASLPQGCAAAQEGAQRYNKNLKVMEYCDGSVWQGVNGVTSCDAGYTLGGTPGTPGAFCMDNAPTSGSWTTAQSNCQARTPSRKTNPSICSMQQYDKACQLNLPLTSFFGPNPTYNWVREPNWSNAYYVIRYSTIGSTCPMYYDNTGSEWPNNHGREITAWQQTELHQYRCCYE